jgi:hypothetical protein
MLSNFLKKMISSQFVRFAQVSFLYTGEAKLSIEMSTFNLAKEAVPVQWGAIQNDAQFLVSGCGVYILVWFAQLLDNAFHRKDKTFISLIISAEKAFSAPGNEIDFTESLNMIDASIKALIIKHDAKVNFFIHPQMKSTMVQSVNIPLAYTDEAELYMLILLTEYMLRQYPRSVVLLKNMVRDLFSDVIGDNDVFSRPCVHRAYRITNEYTTRAFES